MTKDSDNIHCSPRRLSVESSSICWSHRLVQTTGKGLIMVTMETCPTYFVPSKKVSVFPSKGTLNKGGHLV